MDQHRTLIGLAVGPADLDLMPLTVHWDYAAEATPPQGPGARTSGWRPGKGPALRRALAWQTTHIAVWCRRTA